MGHPEIPESVFESARNAAALVLLNWREQPNRDAYVHTAFLNAAQKALEAAAPLLWAAWTEGKAVVELPKPEGIDDDGCPYWIVNGRTYTAANDQRGEPVLYVDESEIEFGYELKSHCAAKEGPVLLAASAAAEAMADEHNAARQDAEATND